MAYTPFHDPWHDYPDLTTPITAAALDYIEAGIEDAAADADAAATAASAASAAAAAAASDLSDHIADATAAHAASAVSFSPTGSIAATDTQAAVAEVATDAASDLSTHEADTTSVHGITNTANLYVAGGTDVALADGGTGASLADPNADRIFFWDDSAGAATWLTPGTNLTITGTTIDATGGSTPVETRYLPISLANADANGLWTVSALTAWDAGHWEFVKDVVGIVTGIVRVPKELDASPTASIVLEIAANATSGATSLQVLSKNVADGGSMNPSSLTAETTQDITVPGTAYFRKQVTFALTNQPAGDDLLIVQIKHRGTDGNDTLAVNTLMFSAALKINCLPA